MHRWVFLYLCVPVCLHAYAKPLYCLCHVMLYCIVWFVQTLRIDLPLVGLQVVPNLLNYKFLCRDCSVRGDEEFSRVDGGLWWFCGGDDVDGVAGIIAFS